MDLCSPTEEANRDGQSGLIYQSADQSAYCENRSKVGKRQFARRYLDVELVLHQQHKYDRIQRGQSCLCQRVVRTYWPGNSPLVHEPLNHSYDPLSRRNVAAIHNTCRRCSFHPRRTEVDSARDSRARRFTAPCILTPAAKIAVNPAGSYLATGSHRGEPAKRPGISVETGE